MTTTRFRAIALGMSGAIESSHMNHPDFRANGRIFATLQEDGRRGMVKLTPGQQREFIDGNPEAFTPASGAWGRQGCTMVTLSAIDETTLGEAMTLAWQNSLVKPASRQKASPAARRKSSPAARPAATRTKRSAKR
ncbi:MAG TPA: MmcQ/YjbR family DNA-binding protein [Vicinamibacterales bacterium]|nr:MmcQ/YjbR family DNA-binding protein [Vicinamibacterales bacterium]